MERVAHALHFPCDRRVGWRLVEVPGDHEFVSSSSRNLRGSTGPVTRSPDRRRPGVWGRTWAVGFCVGLWTYSDHNPTEKARVRERNLTRVPAEILMTSIVAAPRHLPSAVSGQGRPCRDDVGILAGGAGPRDVQLVATAEQPV